MSVRAALVGCVVLSLQDSCVFYPCCKGCYSRIQEELNNTERCRCPKCGYICQREEVDHRYRLSVRVTRDKCIFGLTVFGTCLNPFFGIHATGLHRLVENSDEPVASTIRSTLLVKAVQDCFIGRYFIFCIKVTETEPEPWLQRPAANAFSSKDTAQLIASQMILPKASGLDGCTVVTYYQSLLKRATENKLGIPDNSKTSRMPEISLRLLSSHSPASSFNSATLSASGLPSFLRSQHPDSTLTPTPPWQQSLGLVTSSAEQEEDFGTLESRDEYSRQVEGSKTPYHTQRDSPGNHDAIRERVLSPLPLLGWSCNNNLSLAKYSNLSHDKAAQNTPIQDNWFSPFQSAHKSSRKKEVFTEKLTETFLSDSLAWEDLPFSESLTEFLGGANKDKLEINQKETASNNLDVKSQDKISSKQSTSVCQNYKLITDSCSPVFQGITNSPAANGADRHDLGDQVSKNPLGCLNKSQAKNTFSVGCKQQEHFCTSLENEQEQSEEDTYNCSADLFSGSLTIDMDTNTLNKQTETIETISESSQLLSKPKTHHIKTQKFPVPQLTPHVQKQKGHRHSMGDNLIPQCPHELDFIPPSQSTPLVKLAAISSSSRTPTFGESPLITDSPDTCIHERNLPKHDCKKQAQITSSFCKRSRDRESTKENLVLGTPSSRCRPASKRRFWKHKKRLLPQHSLRIPSGNNNNTGPPGMFNHKSNCDVSLWDNEHNEVLLSPTTTATKTQRRLEEKQIEGVSCNAALLGQTLTSSQRVSLQSQNCDTKTSDDGASDGSKLDLLDGDSEACNWSRDLFSDSL